MSPWCANRGRGDKVRDVIAMSSQELDRVGVVAAVVEKRMRQREAAERLGVTQRQVKRLAAR